MLQSSLDAAFVYLCNCSSHFFLSSTNLWITRFSNCLCGSDSTLNLADLSRTMCSCCLTHTWYFSFFLHEQKFWRMKFTPKKRVNYDKIHKKLPIFCIITAKYTVNCQFFALNLKKIYTCQKNLHWRRRPRRRQLSGMPTNLFMSIVRIQRALIE